MRVILFIVQERTTRMTHILLADDHVLFRDALTEFMNALRPDWAVIHASRLQDVRDCLREKKISFDLVLLDICMPDIDTIRDVEQLVRGHPRQYFAILSGFVRDDEIYSAMQAGMRAYLPKTMRGKSLIQAMELVMQGEKFVPLGESGTNIMPSFYRHASAPDSFPCCRDAKPSALAGLLSRREKEVVSCLGEGLSNKEIGALLNIHVATVKLHIGSICKKLGADNRTQAAIMAYRHGLIDPSSQRDTSKRSPHGL